MKNPRHIVLRIVTPHKRKEEKWKSDKYLSCWRSVYDAMKCLTLCAFFHGLYTFPEKKYGMGVLIEPWFIDFVSDIEQIGVNIEIFRFVHCILEGFDLP